jgi:predicted RNA-binding Zn-ribbon protein involved in translation (DUF1610 family)
MNKGAKLPKPDVVKFEIVRVLKKHKQVDSQKRMAYLVNKNLKKVEPNYSVSPGKIRILASRTPGVKIRVETRKGKFSDKCPSCEAKVRKLYTKNLKGRKILYKIACPKCSFSGKNGKWTPKKYSFGMITS